MSSCPYLRADAHDGWWDMRCEVTDKECCWNYDDDL
jgi:hypothetical protein